jgi:hypothetical protein
VAQADRSSGQYEIDPAFCCWALSQRGRGDRPECMRAHGRRRPSGARGVAAQQRGAGARSCEVPCRSDPVHRRLRVHQRRGVEARWAFPAGPELSPLPQAPSVALTRDSPAHTPKGSTGGYDYQRLKVSGSHSAILALIQLFELWKSLTAFPGPTSSSRRARS